MTNYVSVSYCPIQTVLIVADSSEQAIIKEFLTMLERWKLMEINMDTTAQQMSLNGLAQILVTRGLLEEQKARESLQKSTANGIPLVSYLVNKKILSAKQIATEASINFGTPLIDLDCIDRHSIPRNLVSEKLIRRHNVLPVFKRGSVLFIAVSDPSMQVALDEIKFHTGLITHCVLAEVDKLGRLIEDVLNDAGTIALGDLSDASLDELDISSGNDENNNESTTNGDDAPIVRFVHKVLLDAINKGASDIHFEPYEKSYRIRFRLDGILKEIVHPPVTLGSRISSRLKVMSQLDISERRIPQDGRFKMNISRNRSIDFRVSTCPTAAGEKIVMRILDPTAVNLDVEALGMTEKQKDLFLNAIHQPQGMVLVTGPTGSGKTVTLYTGLNILNTPEINISTAEDPVEIKVPGINQVNINTKTGLTFSTALRSFLRQDPDIIMVGEMRDLETAEIGIKASQTGHLVLSTLHTNSAPETLTRLVNMGVAPFNIATSTNLVIAQRLARKLCDKCKTPMGKVPDKELINQGFDKSEIKTLSIYSANGCDDCTNGYKGRIGLYEVLVISDEISEIIMTGGTSLDIMSQARKEGMETLRDSGLNLVRNAVTSLKEINRVTQD